MRKLDEAQRFANIMRNLITSAAGLASASPGDMVVKDEEGIRYLKFGTPWVQGAVRLDNPDALEVEYIQQMMVWTLFKLNPKKIVQLGLGSASLTRFCNLHFPDAQVEAVEINPKVIEVCHESFFLPTDNPNINIVNADAMDYVTDPVNKGSVDVLQVDLYDEHARRPALGSQRFYDGCANILSDDGIMTVNIFCDYPEHNDYIGRIGSAFEGVAWLPEVHDSNIVAIGFKKNPNIYFDDLYAKADKLSEKLGLPARSWVDGLYKWMSK